MTNDKDHNVWDEEAPPPRHMRQPVRSYHQANRAAVTTDAPAEDIDKLFSNLTLGGAKVQGKLLRLGDPSTTCTTHGPVCGIRVNNVQCDDTKGSSDMLAIIAPIVTLDDMVGGKVKAYLDTKGRFVLVEPTIHSMYVDALVHAIPIAVQPLKGEEDRYQDVLPEVAKWQTQMINRSDRPNWETENKNMTTFDLPFTVHRGEFNGTTELHLGTPLRLRPAYSLLPIENDTLTIELPAKSLLKGVKQPFYFAVFFLPIEGTMKSFITETEKSVAQKEEMSKNLFAAEDRGECLSYQHPISQCFIIIQPTYHCFLSLPLLLFSTHSGTQSQRRRCIDLSSWLSCSWWSLF